MAHVSSAVREMYLDSLAAAFAAGGLAPLVSGTRNIQRVVRQDFLASSRAAMRQDRVARLRGEPPAMVPLADPGAVAVSALPTTVAGSSSTWAGTVGTTNLRNSSGGGKSHVW